MKEEEEFYHSKNFPAYVCKECHKATVKASYRKKKMRRIDDEFYDHYNYHLYTPRGSNIL
jgi:hypothetical protein